MRVPALAVVCSVCAVLGVAHAQPYPPPPPYPVPAPYPVAPPTYDWTLSIGYVHQNYQEQNPGLNAGLTATIADQEQGALPEIRLALHSVSGDVYRALHLRYANGRDTYTGYACDPSGSACVPDTTATWNNLLSGAARLGIVWGLPGLQAIPFVTAGAWSWNRDVQGNAIGSGVSEHYVFGYYGVGMLFRLALAAETRWSVAGVAGETAQPTMVTGGQEFHLGGAPLWQVGTALRVGLGGGWHLEGRATYTQFHFGASPVYQSGAYLVQEPASTTQQATYTVGLGTRF